MKTLIRVLQILAVLSLPINFGFIVIGCSNIREMKRHEQAMSEAHSKLVVERELAFAADGARETSLLAPGRVVVYKIEGTMTLVYYVKNDDQDATKAWITYISQGDHWTGLVVPRSSLMTISDSLKER